MSRFKSQASFQEDGYKNVYCPNCGRFLTRTYLTDRKIKEKRCKCKNVKTVYPPRIEFRNERKGAYWVEEYNSCWTPTPEL